MDTSGEINEFFEPEIQGEDVFSPIRWTDLYGNDHPVKIEIGFGKGRFLISASERFPNVNYFGIERKTRYFKIASARILKRRLLNVRILFGDALPIVYKAVPDQSVSAYHIYFPDPWWKKRHKKRRIFGVEFMEALARTLSSGGRIYIATDVKEYFEEIVSIISKNPHFVDLDKPLDLMEKEGYVPTNFEVKRAKAGSQIYRVVFKRD